MSGVTIADVINLVALAIAFAAIVATRADTPGIGRSFKYLLLTGLGLLLFVGLSNVLEHAGITDALDAYEDYAEVLFVPLVAYIAYSRSTAEQLTAAENAERAARSEHALLMSVVDTTPAGILVADDRGDVSFANDEARRITSLGFAGSEAGSGATTTAPDLGSVVKSAPVSGRLDALDHDGSRTWVLVRATPIAIDGSDASHAVIVLEDVTERILAEDELEGYRQGLEQLVDRRTGELIEVNRELTKANEARQRFLANMSHELRTPLNAIIGFTDLLLRELPGPVTMEQRTQLGMVKESSIQLLALVENVLDLARIETGHGVVALVEVDLGSRIRATVASMEPIAEARGIHLRCECPEGVLVETDADKVGQIVRNLVSNAIKFTDAGGTVGIAVTRDAIETRVVVSDTGIGIAPGDQPRIFEAFQQVDSADRARPSGTGLGLAICRELCDLLGYRLTLVSTLGKGSTFTLHMPHDVAHL